MNSAYPYASGDLLDNPQTYFYSAFQGHAFIQAWQASRGACRIELTQLAGTDAVQHESTTAHLLNELIEELQSPTLEVTERQHLDAMLRNFEAKKRIYQNYDPGFTSRDRTDFRDLSLYVRFAEVLVLAYRRWQALPYLNALLKCVDILCAMRAELQADERIRLAQIIADESEFVAVLSDQLDISS